MANSNNGTIYQKPLQPFKAKRNYNTIVSIEVNDFYILIMDEKVLVLCEK